MSSNSVSGLSSDPFPVDFSQMADDIELSPFTTPSPKTNALLVDDLIMQQFSQTQGGSGSLEEYSAPIQTPQLMPAATGNLPFDAGKQYVTATLSLGQQSLAVYNGIYLGGISLELAKLDRKIGDSQAIVALMEAMIDLMAKLIALFQQGGDRATAWSEEVSAATSALKSSWFKTIEKVMQG